MKKDRWGTPLILVAFVTGLVIPIIAIAFTQFPNKIFWQILSTIATFSAVCVSLYAANRPSKRGKLEVQNVRCTVRLFVDQEHRALASKVDGVKDLTDEKHGQFDVSLLCENSGELPIIITRITMGIKVWKGVTAHVDFKVPNDNLIKGNDAKFFSLTGYLNPIFDFRYWIKNISPQEFHESFESFKEDNYLKIELADGRTKNLKFDDVQFDQKVIGQSDEKFSVYLDKDYFNLSDIKQVDKKE